MKVFCILSDERAFRSKSPMMHNAVLKRHGIEGTYVPFNVSAEHLGDAVQGLAALNIAGANVTVPYKEAVMPYLDEISDAASAVGAVNTIVRRNDKLVGDNTDAAGFRNSLTDIGFDPTGESVLVVGAGGAAKAVVYALLRMAAHVTTANRNPDRGRQLTRRMLVETVPLESLADPNPAVKLLVNTTSVSDPREGPNLARILSRSHFPECRLVVDINYGRSENIWQSLAQKHRADFMDGRAMLACQAAESFGLWTGIKVHASEFMEALGDEA